VLLNDLLYDKQTKPHTRLITRLTTPLVFIENLFVSFFGDSSTLVYNAPFHGGILTSPQHDLDFAARRRILQGILNQVEEDNTD
jgi:hypothetical protein